MVVAIGHDREVPSSVSIYAGELSRFPIVFNLVDYVSTTSEYSSSVEGVTIALDPEYDNILTVSVAESVPAGTVANIMFRDQVIMHVTAVAPAKNIPVITLPRYNTNAQITLEGFELPSNYLSPGTSVSFKATCDETTIEKIATYREDEDGKNIIYYTNEFDGIFSNSVYIRFDKDPGIFSVNLNTTFDEDAEFTITKIVVAGEVIYDTTV